MDEHEDVYEAALPELRRKAETNPRLKALLEEMERGRQRRAADDHPRAERIPPRPGCTRTQIPVPLHAHEVTADDAAFLRLLAAATFESHVIVTLPSGKTINAVELTRWLEAQGGDDS